MDVVFHGAGRPARARAPPAGSCVFGYDPDAGRITIDLSDIIKLLCDRFSRWRAAVENRDRVLTVARAAPRPPRRPDEMCALHFSKPRTPHHLRHNKQHVMVGAGARARVLASPAPVITLTPALFAQHFGLTELVVNF
ncbi:hypothetical protein EVAR_66078_1 [Eumeta japonica]|uniref:Uncharacterized protein n=1 Tax=Eumeta variegata TaxID=151549 RepID=A0A4C1ZZD9_EUMVA|nr:hypothetical protein EVAR_66078_1 [Eumeta japonica]